MFTAISCEKFKRLWQYLKSYPPAADLVQQEVNQIAYLYV